MAFLSGVHCSYRCHRKLCQNAEGDQRINVQPGLISLHALFLREHNRLADMYQAQDADGSDDLIFARARRGARSPWILPPTLDLCHAFLFAFVTRAYAFVLDNAVGYSMHAGCVPSIGVVCVTSSVW
jgi:hypothetical protein